MFCCCVSKFIRILVRRDFFEEEREKRRKRSPQKEKKDNTSKTRERKNKGEIREILRETTTHFWGERQIFERKQTKIFYSFFLEMLLHINAVLKIHDKPLLSWDKQTEKTFSLSHFWALCDWSSFPKRTTRNKRDAFFFFFVFFFFVFFFFFARTGADGVLLSKMGIHPRGEERW